MSEPNAWIPILSQVVAAYWHLCCDIRLSFSVVRPTVKDGLCSVENFDDEQEKGLQLPRIRPLRELVQRHLAGHLLEPKLAQHEIADLNHLAELPVRLPETLAES